MTFAPLTKLADEYTLYFNNYVDKVIDVYILVATLSHFSFVHSDFLISIFPPQLCRKIEFAYIFKMTVFQAIF